MEKRTAVVCGDVIHDILVRPGTTVRDITRQLDLPRDCWISKRDGVRLGDDEEVYGQLQNGEKLHASARAEVGR